MEPSLANWEGWGRHRTYFVDEGTIGVETPHNIERIKVGTRLSVWVGVWLAGSVSDYSTTLWLHLAS